MSGGLPRLSVAADSGYGDITAFLLGFDDGGLHYVVAVKGSTTACPSGTVPLTVPASPLGRRPSAAKLSTYRDPARVQRNRMSRRRAEAEPVRKFVRQAFSQRGNRITFV
ncbi:transposase [Actinomadura scrupuli]|uniref:transposase n=1 Tax=Actinomadura scrupuli TaxID=559629 RepID=UPI003D9609D4